MELERKGLRWLAITMLAWIVIVCTAYFFLVSCDSKKIVPVVASKESAVFPQNSVSLLEFAQPIQDQGNTLKCTAYALAGALEILEATKGNKVKLDEESLWGRYANYGLFSAIRASETFGAQVKGYLHLVFHDPKEKNFTSLISSFQQVRESIDEKRPIFIGMMIPSQLERCAAVVTKTDSAPSEYGHAMTIIGYTEDSVILRNSWGKHCGENGYHRMLWSVLEKSEPMMIELNKSKFEQVLMPSVALSTMSNSDIIPKKSGGRKFLTKEELYGTQ